MSEESIALPITGMTCANCAANIERSLNKIDGIHEVAVNFASEKANVRFDPGQLKISDLVENIKHAGYGVVSQHLELPISGMTCANCAANIERALNKKTDGIVKASVNFASESAAIDYLPDVVGVDEIVAAIEKAGYGTILPDDGREGEDAEQIARQAEIRNQTQKFVVGADFALPLFALSMLRDFNLTGARSHASWESIGDVIDKLYKATQLFNYFRIQGSLSFEPGSGSTLRGNAERIGPPG
jgi:Cu+-exporting ATPase